MKVALLGVCSNMITLQTNSAIELIKQEVLGTDPEAIQKKEFVRQLKKLNHNNNVTDGGNDQS